VIILKINPINNIQHYMNKQKFKHISKYKNKINEKKESFEDVLQHAISKNKI